MSFQTATQQTKKTDYNKYPEQKTAGGGFGPVRYEHAVEPRYFFNSQGKQNADSSKCVRTNQRALLAPGFCAVIIFFPVFF